MQGAETINKIHMNIRKGNKMGKRKYIRAMLRGEAEKIGAKPSKYVNREFDRIQIKKYGIEKREINKARGTAPKRRWRALTEIGIMTASNRREKEEKSRG